MDARRTAEQFGTFAPSGFARTAQEVEALRLAVARGRDVALIAGLRRLGASLWQDLVAVGSALAHWPDRRSTLENLRLMSDRQLDDIGLARGEIARIFEPDFRRTKPRAALGNRGAAAGETSQAA